MPEYQPVEILVQDEGGARAPLAPDSPLPVNVVSDRSAVVKLPTYRAVFSFAAVSGDAVELVAPAGKIVRVSEIAVTKPTIAETVIVRRRLNADTSGTSTVATVSLHDPTELPPSASVKLYTVAPTAGLTGGDFVRAVVAANDVLILDFTKPGTKPLMLRGAGSIVINVDASATFNGWIEWTEESG